MVDENEILVNFCIKGGVEELPQSFSLVEVVLPKNNCAAFVGALVTISLRFFLIFQRRPLFRGKVGKFGVTIEFQFVDIVVTFFDEKI